MILYQLNKKQDVIGIVSSDVISATLEEQINTAGSLKFVVAKKLSAGCQYVLIQRPGAATYMCFKILTETQEDNKISYTAVESAYDELGSYSFIKDMRPQNRTAKEMLQQILSATRFSVGYVADTGTQSTNFYYTTVLASLQSVVNLFDLEVTFDVVFDPIDNQVKKRMVNLYTQMGSRTGRRYEYGDKLLSVTCEQSSDTLVTALVGRGSSVQVSEGTDGSPDGYSRKITFADVVWKKSAGDPLDKPAKQEYLEDPAATAIYGFSDGAPRIGLVEFDAITDPALLLKATYDKLQELKRPKVSFKASVTDVGSLNLGDTVAIIRHDLKIEYLTRVYKVTHDLLNAQNNTIELGDDFQKASITSTISAVQDTVQLAKDYSQSALQSANGKNTNFYGASQPLHAVEGDLWYKDLGNGETEMYQYKNGNWELVVSTADTTAVKRQVDQVIKDTNAHFKEIDDKYVPNETYQTEKQAFSTAVTKASETAQAAKATADTASANATEANNSASEARAKVDDVAKTVTKNGKAIGEIKSDVSGVKATYATLDGKVTSASARAGALEAALSDGKGGLISVKAENNRIESLIDSKADDNEYNTFKQQTSTTLSQKANKTDLNGYVTGTQFKQTADKVDTLASDVKSVKTKADTIETTMNSTSFANSVVKASGIDTKVAGYDTTIRKLIGKDGTTGDLNTLVSAYSNETNQTKKQTTNLISALDYNGTTGNFGSGFAKKVADAYGTTESYKSLSGKIDGLQIGGTNLLDDSERERSAKRPATGHTDIFMQTLATPPTGTVFTASFEAKATTDKTTIANHFYDGSGKYADGKCLRTVTCQTSTPTGNSDGYAPLSLSTQWKRYWITWTWSQEMTQSNIHRVLIGRYQSNFADGTVYIRRVKLEKGNKATDWCMSDNDVNKRIQDQADALTAYQAEVKRTYALSSSVYTKTETQTRENALKNSTINSLKATDDWKKLIKITQNSSWIQDATGFQQQAWKYNLDSSGQLIGKKSFEDGNVGEWYCADLKTPATLQKGGPVNGFYNWVYSSTGSDLYYGTSWIPVKPGTKFYVEALCPNMKSVYNGLNIIVAAYLRYEQGGKTHWAMGPSATITPDHWGWVKGVVTVPDNVTRVLPCIATKDKNGKGGASYVAYASFTKLDEYTQSSMASIKQSSDGIGLKVAQLVGGSDISKIDMTSAAVKIDSKHILLNGDVAIDGTTFAKKIKATGITADMMLAGTIDAAKINVVNIDASNITTGTLTAVEIHQNKWGTDTWVNEDGIHNQMGSDNVWIKDGTLAAFDSGGQGVYMESGKLTLASYAYWQTGGGSNSINYGVIKCDDNIFGAKGVGVIGKGGFNIRTDNCDLSYLSGPLFAKFSGTGIIGADDGRMMLGGDKTIFITAGEVYEDISISDINNRPYVQVGGRLNNPADLSKAGSSIVINAWDIKLNACGKDNRNIIMNRLTYNGEHTITLNDSTSDLWWGPKMHAPSFVNTSALSKKMNIKKLDVQTAVNAIKNTDIYDYQFKEFGETGKHYASLIIDDVNDRPQYRAAGAFVDGLGRDDGTQLGYLTVVVQSLLKEIDTLKERIDK
ncbi:phage tail spike protein [Ligilactobacillus ruminis]|uniref:phage tail spike protein n=1 Tax=Ligilactobacillus ruminis TaxID=1623 RepID=UPI002B4B9FF8|nr:phage tail spike protein [Ligilactobacillus ruminis]